MQYYEGMTFSEFKQGINKLFQQLVNNIIKLKVISKEDVVGSFKIINNKSVNYIGQFTYFPSNGQRNLKVNFYQLHEIYKDVFLKMGVLFEDFCKIIIFHEIGHAIDFDNSKVQEKPLHLFTNELACTLKKINDGHQDAMCEANKVISQINKYVKENIYVKEQKANEIAGMLIKKTEKNNHSLKRAFKIFLAHHKQYLKYEDIPIIRGVIAKRSVSPPVQDVMKEYLQKRTNEKYREILNQIHKERSYKKENFILSRF